MTNTSSRWAWVSVAAFLAYCAAEILLLRNHLSFRDEAQAWLWALEFDSWRDYLIVPYEGHPPVWYWILKLFSFGLSFDQARWFSLIVAIANAALLMRLFGRRPVLYALILATQSVLVFWGFFFRPYGLILTLLLCALVAHREKRPVLGTWILAFACGLHFLSGVIFALWLLFQIRERVSLWRVVWPALLALGFGALAVLSALGNPASGIELNNVLLGTLQVFTLPFKLSKEPWPVWLILMGAMIGISFWRDKFLLVALVLSIAGFGLFSQVVYGAAEWHYGFILALILMALVLIGDRARVWPMIVILMPQAINGLISAGILMFTPYSSEEWAFEAVRAEAGAALDTKANLISWPEFVLSAPSALNEFRFISGNTGKVIGPVVYSKERLEDAFSNSALLANTRTPFWLVCLNCDSALGVIGEAGLTVSETFPPTPGNNGEAFAAYRVDRQ